ncbi:MAG: DEAD/DEAH box helicase [Candidatus Bathyarchaeota archaeon]|nr:DEAD/DEAH box helicase [Candidatus Bathyarchaeota archaeon]
MIKGFTLRVKDLPLLEKVKEAVAASGISELYPPQEEAIKVGALEGRNLVLASPTASGKTLTAELCALKHVAEQNGKVLYLTPLRALASEKYAEFKKYSTITKSDGKHIRVGISTGDFDSSDPWLGSYDIIISTNEKADSLLRHRSKWVDEISLVVTDEIHLLNDSERGPTLEVVLARLMQTSPEIQILALSATIKNVEEIANWLKAQYVTTDWRPVQLKEGVLLNREIQFKDGGAVRIGKHASNTALNLALHTVKTGGQVLIFASTRKNAVSLARHAAVELSSSLSKPTKRALNALSQRILSTGEKTRISELLADLIKQGVAFHHAGLGSGHRKALENGFREGKIKVLTATPTLAFGVNLPARMVIIHDYRRYEVGYGYYPISVLEYKQMAGRAGRPKYDKFGEAVLLAKTDDEQDYLMESYVLSEPEQIWSKLAVERILRPHVLSTIAAQYAKTEQGVYDFFGKTFYAFQYDPKAMKMVITRILKFLYDEQMIDAGETDISATKFGRRVSELYIDPVSAVFVRDAFHSRADTITDLSFFQVIAHTPDMYPKLRPYSSEIDELAVFVDQHRNEFMFEPPNELADNFDFQEFLGEAKLARVLQSWIEEVTEDQIIERFRVQPGDLYRLTDSAKWLLYASHELATLFKQRDLVSKLNELMERSAKGVKAELLPLVRLEGVGRARARILFNSGFETILDLKHAPVEKLTSLPLIGPRVAKKIKEQVGGFVKSEQWKKLAEDIVPEQQPLSEYY